MSDTRTIVRRIRMDIAYDYDNIRQSVRMLMSVLAERDRQIVTLTRKLAKRQKPQLDAKGPA